MLASITQARALYEFFFGNNNKGGDNARAKHFCTKWNAPESVLYKNYMATQKPANKRVFHLVYNRPIYSGGVTHDESSHIKNQVLNFAKDLRQITEQFVQMADCQFTLSIRGALQNALQEAAKKASVSRISNPFTVKTDEIVRAGSHPPTRVE